MTRFVKTVVTSIFIGTVSLALMAAESPDAAEINAWEAALQSGEVATLQQFVAQYPDSVFSSEAQDLLTSLQPEGTAEPESAATRSLEGVPLSLFEQPLVEDVFADEPRSIKQLSEATPLFAPVEGLPVEYWQEEVCSNCHSWDKANLCVQGQYFAQRDQAALNRIQHPYGGFFKAALKRWAAGGCQ